MYGRNLPRITPATRAGGQGFESSPAHQPNSRPRNTLRCEFYCTILVRFRDVRDICRLRSDWTSNPHPTRSTSSRRIASSSNQGHFIEFTVPAQALQAQRAAAAVPTVVRENTIARGAEESATLGR